MAIGPAEAVGRIIVNICRTLGFTDDALMVLRGVISDSLFPIILMLTDMYVIPGIITSGREATAELNCMITNIIARCAWYTYYESVGKFDDYVKMFTYGDDNIFSTRHAAFNAHTMRDFCVQYMGMNYTSADKYSELQPFTDKHKLSFLKREFIYSEEFGRIMAPLNITSLSKPLIWILPSKNVSIS